MKETDIIQIALENLEKATGIRGKWKRFAQKEVDGRLELFIAGHHLALNAEVKNEIREHQINGILDQAQKNTPLIIVAKRIFPRIKEAMRERNIPYLEINGNIWLRNEHFLIWIDTNKQVPIGEEKVNRAFTKTGLKVVFQFLLDENWINYPYREIAKRTDVALGNVNYIMNGLLENGFMLKKTRKEFRLVRKKELLEKFMTAYKEKLKPALHIETFRFINEDDRQKWKQLQFQNQKTFWGGEPAGALFTNYLRPEVFTIYTTETRNELIKNYRLIPDPAGNVFIYKKFWTYTEVNDIVAPPLLIYIDLMNTGDRRCIETAGKIYEQIIQDKFE